MDILSLFSNDEFLAVYVALNFPVISLPVKEFITDALAILGSVAVPPVEPLTKVVSSDPSMYTLTFPFASQYTFWSSVTRT